MEAGSEDVSGVVLRLEPGVTLAGVINYEGEVTDVPLRLLVEPADGSARMAVPPQRPTADTFEISGLRRGPYFLRLPAGSPWTIKSITSAGREYQDVPLDMSTGDRRDVSVLLTRHGATLSGVVRDSRGRSVRQALVVVFPVHEASWFDFGYTPPRIRTAPVTGEGGYVCTGLPAGEYYVVAVDPALRDVSYDPSVFKAAQPMATRVKLSWGEARALDLRLTAIAVP